MRPAIGSHRKLSLLALAFVASACDSATAPAAAAGLSLEARASHFDTNIGVPARITYTLRNESDATQTLVFPGCGVLPYVATLLGKVVHPPNGAWGCYAAVTTVRLDPGQAIIHTEYVAPGAEPSYLQRTLFLPPGPYRAFAEADFRLGSIDGARIRLRSRDAHFDIRS
jgi:hypothetical protein